MQQQKRTVNAREYIAMLADLAEDGREVSMIVTGSSMNPFLCHGRDVVFFSRPDRPLRPGDMVFYKRADGQYVMHRIVRQYDQQRFDMIGDAQLDIERGVSRGQIFALVTRVQRKGKEIGPGNFWWVFFAHVWRRMIPVRRAVMALYAAGKREK